MVTIRSLATQQDIKLMIVGFSFEMFVFFLIINFVLIVTIQANLTNEPMKHEDVIELILGNEI